MTIATGPVQSCVSCLGLSTVDERRVTTEECDHLLHSVKLVVTCGLNEEALPGDGTTWEHLVQEHCPCLQLLVAAGGLVVKLQHTQLASLFCCFFCFVHTGIIFSPDKKSLRVNVNFSHECGFQL